MPGSTALGSPKRSALLSALIHVVAIVLILIVTTSKHSVLTELIPVRDTPIYLPHMLRANRRGGGGGQHSPLPVPKGQPPKPSPRPFTMPVMLIRTTPPTLPMPPEVQAAVTSTMPDLDLSQIGSLTGRTGPMSGGPGRGNGLGDGDGPSAGGKHGPGIGDGGPGVNGLPRKNLTKPVLLSQIEPEYSDEARKAKVQGTVVLSIVVTASGQVGNIRVMRGLGLGLDERAIEAVRQWKFRAATVDGKPVPTTAVVEVNFRLL